MKRYKNIRKIMGAIVSVCILLSSNAIGVSAHEIYYEGSTPIPLKWYDVSNRTAKLKINGDLLHSDCYAHYSAIRTAWPNASSRVSVTAVEFSRANVALATPTMDYWNSRWVGRADEIYGVCDSSSTDGLQLNSWQNAKASSGLISYAGILITPYLNFHNSTHMKKTMVHEIGHALGLGHTTEVSVMIQGVVKTYYTPQPHDVADLNNKY